MYKSILLPIDLAHESSWEKSLPVARALCEAFGAKLHVITVAQDIRTQMISQYFPGDFEERIARLSAMQLSDIVAKELSGIDVTEHVAIGQVYREIVAAAEREHCDLIVMASHRPELADILMGPNADHVARNTTASVMIVRP
jgi:nucleotide-binding universal stress UspA family protein